MADQNSFAATLYRYLDRLEVFCLIGAGVSVVALSAKITGANQGVTIFLSGLAGVFFLNAHKPPVQSPEGEKRDFITLLSLTILPKVMWIGCAVGTIGLLFHILQLEGARQMLMIGVASGAISVMSYAVLSLINANVAQPLIPALYRVVPILLLSGYFLYGSAA